MLQFGGTFRINDLIKTAKFRQWRATLKNKSGFDNKYLSIDGWSDAAYEEQGREGKCRLAYLGALLPDSAQGICHVLKLPSPSRLTRQKAAGQGEIYASSEFVWRVGFLWGFFSFCDTAAGMAGMGTCETCVTHLSNNRRIAGR